MLKNLIIIKDCIDSLNQKGLFHCTKKYLTIADAICICQLDKCDEIKDDYCFLNYKYNGYLESEIAQRIYERTTIYEEAAAIMVYNNALFTKNNVDHLIRLKSPFEQNIEIFDGIRDNIERNNAKLMAQFCLFSLYYKYLIEHSPCIGRNGSKLKYNGNTKDCSLVNYQLMDCSIYKFRDHYVDYYGILWESIECHFKMLMAESN